MKLRSDIISKSIVESIRIGDKDAFKVFFNYYYIKVRNFADGMLKNREEAENIAQNVFMKIWLNRAMLSPEKSIDHYIFTIVRNEINDSFRRSAYFNDYSDYVMGSQTEDDAFSSEQNYDFKEIVQIVDEAVEKMPDQRKLIFKMSRFSGLSNDEIAKRLDISRRTVEKHISLALHTIKKSLSDFYFFIFIFFIISVH